MTIIALMMIIIILTDTMKRRIITIEKFQWYYEGYSSYDIGDDDDGDSLDNG